jgi:SSS family transporter
VRPADLAVFVGYLALSLVVGAATARRQRNAEEFFLAGRSMRWLPVGLSIMVTAFSAINYTAFSGEVFEHGLYVALALPAFVLVAPPVTRLVMPFFHRMALCSAYEYLERRFDRRVRRLASGLFILWRLLWMATLVYVPCRVLGLVTGMDTATLVLVAGVATTVYTLAGGMRAVMWTGVMQFVVIIGGLVLALGVAGQRADGGLWGLIEQGAAAGLTRPFYPFDPAILSLDPQVRISLWSALLGTFVAFLARYGCDQVIVQRYFSARSLADAQRGFHASYVAMLVALVSLALLGYAIHAHVTQNSLVLTGGARAMAGFAAFVRSLPPGLTGLIVAGLFAATMSSLDAGINSCAAAYLIDFRRETTPPAGPLMVRQGRWASLLFGAAATAGALQIGRLGSIFEVANRVINGLGSPLLGLFVLAMFSRRANCRGVWVGGLVGTAASAWLSLTADHLALHYYAVLNLAVTWVPCYVFSLIENRWTAPPTPAQLAWTWAGRRDA